MSNLAAVLTFCAGFALGFVACWQKTPEATGPRPQELRVMEEPMLPRQPPAPVEMPAGNPLRAAERTAAAWFDNDMVIWNSATPDYVTAAQGVKSKRADSGVYHVMVHRHGFTGTSCYNPACETLDDAVAACLGKIERIRTD